MLVDNPTSTERVVETGEIGEGGDRTLVIDAAAEDAVFAELERLHDDGARFTAVSEERGEVDFGDPDHLVVIDPIDGSMNAKRGLGHHALSIAVADGPTMADVVFGYVYDLGPGEEWRATRGGGAFLNDVPLADPPPERRRADGRLELVAIESADPSWLAASSDALNEVTGRIRAMGSIAVSLCQVAATRVDGMATLWRCRAVDAAAAQLIVRESGGLVAFPAMEEPARRAAGPAAALARRGRPHARGPRPARHRSLPLMVDWRIAERVADTVAGPAGTSNTPAEGRRRGDGGDARAARHRLRAHRARRAAAALEAVDRKTWARANLATMSCTLEPVIAAAWARGPLQSAGGMLVGVEAGGIVGFMGRSVLGQYEIALLDPTRPPRLLLVAPNLRAGRRGLRGRRGRAARVGRSSTSSPTRCSSPGCRGCATTSPAMLRELLASIKVQVDPGALLRMPSLPSTDDLRAVGRGARRRPGRRHGRARAQGRHRPPAGDDGDDRGPRRARDGRRRRPGAALAAEAARVAGEAPRARSPRW